MKIHKYELSLYNETFINMPTKSDIMDIQLINGNPVMWALVDPDSDEITVKIDRYWTGDKIYTNDFKKEYIATVQDGYHVYHFFMSYEL